MSHICGTLTFNLLISLNKPINEISMYTPNDNLLDPLFIGTFFVHSIIGSMGTIIIHFILIE